MSFASLISAPSEVTTRRGYTYQIQRVDTLDLLRTGKGGILRAAIEEVRRAGGKVPESDEDIARLGARVAQVGLDQIAEMNDHTKAVVCAGVVGGYNSTDKVFEPIRLVLTRNEHDPKASIPCVWVTHIQPDVVELYNAIMALSAGNEGAPEVAALFRGPTDRGEAAHPGDRVQRDPVDGRAVESAGDGV